MSKGPDRRWISPGKFEEPEEYISAEHVERMLATLRTELAKHQESEFHPDWSLLQATREALQEARDVNIERCEGIHSALESSLPEQDLSEHQRGYEQGIDDYYQAIRALKEMKE